MLNRSLRLFCLAALAAAGCAAGDQNANVIHPPGPCGSESPLEPFFNARAHTTDYAGPGRDLPPPQDLDEVRIGWFGPEDPAHPTAGLMWQAVTLAVEEANRAGGYDGLPFRLIASWSENPWGTGVKGLTRLVYSENVWAMVGAPDGPSAHLAAQIVAKARLAFISPVATDKTANLANVPWIFSCAPGDHLHAPVLARSLVSRARGGSIAVVSGTDHDSRMFATELLKALGNHGVFPALHLESRPGTTEFDAHLQSVEQVNPAVVSLIAGPLESARFLTALRRGGSTAPRLGGPQMGRRLFVETAGLSAEGVIFPLLWHPSVGQALSADFAERFRNHFGVEPDYTAAHTYDGMNLLIAAVRRAGLNRVRIRDAVRELSPWSGVSGSITWDPAGQSQRPVGLGTVRGGQLTPIGR